MLALNPSIRIKKTSRFLTLINIHAPTEKKRRFKKLFYEEVEQMATNIPHSDNSK